MANYLTENTLFSCSGCGAEFSAKEFSAGQASVAGHKILSLSAKLFIKGAPPPACPFLPGTPPPPCAYIPGSAKFMGAGADFDHTHGKTALLTEKASWQCINGGAIKVSDVGVSKKKFYQGAGGIAAQSGKDADKTPQKKATSAAGMGQSDSTNGQEAASDEISGRVATGPYNAPGKLRLDELHKALKCHKCELSDECETLTKICESEFVCQSALLKKNYEAAIDGRNARPPSSHEYLWRDHPAEKAYRNARTAAAQAGLKWSYAAHHILSGLQVVEKNKALLSLFKAFAYDINSAENCVMLLGKASDVSLKDMEDAERKVHKYDCMAKGRLQWHGGHHKYKINGELVKKIENQLIMRKMQNPENIKCYAELLELRLEDISEKWSAKKRICPKLARDAGTSPDSRHRRARTDFFNDINRLAEEIRLELVEFSQKPHRSYPWFVSMAAWMYAFNLLRTSYIIAITDNGAELELEKFRLTRHGETLQTHGQTLAIKKRGVFKFDNRKPTQLDIRECVEFCGNVIFFAMKENLLEKTGEDHYGESRCLGFRIASKDIFTLKTPSPEAELTNEQTKLLVWIGERDYKPAPGACGLKSERLAAANKAFGLERRA